jgi:hypothetical protein
VLAEQRHPGLPLDLLGFTCSDGRLHVDIQAGAGA